ncbi:hypothetical protein OUZ56_003621 [Daphnia magna]|uniref:Uncharacterized protein n=1 Tax=Daphnia magna TaxID=35525 RepID=A0ABR0A9C3_9CRUS|nr:hypothetical protein OUZ56_003621 [Daphnia magna]
MDDLMMYLITAKISWVMMTLRGEQFSALYPFCSGFHLVFCVDESHDQALLYEIQLSERAWISG